MEYFIIEEQDLDWQPVIRKFATEGTLNGSLDFEKKQSGMGLFLSEKSRSMGFTSVKDLFNAWWNLKAQGKIK